MRITKLPTIFLLLLIIPTLGFGQEIVEDENWLAEIIGSYCGSPVINYRFRTFTMDDVIKAKQKLKSIKQKEINTEWEGLYYSETGIGDSQMILNSEGGFLRFYCYHYLDSLDYGKVKISSDSIQLISEKTSNQKKKNLLNSDLIKVKFGEKHFLVPENRLQEFIHITAGLNKESDDFYYYWAKQDDIDKKVSGIPILPVKYKHLLRYPIEAKIIDIGTKQIIPNSQSTEEYNFDDIHYPVTLDAGKDKNIKVGMDFFVEDLNEWIKITEVYQKISVGYFRRDFDSKGEEKCRDGRGGYIQLTPCKEIKIGMKVRTKTYL